MVARTCEFSDPGKNIISFNSAIEKLFKSRARHAAAMGHAEHNYIRL